MGSLRARVLAGVARTAAAVERALDDDSTRGDRRAGVVEPEYQANVSLGDVPTEAPGPSVVRTSAAASASVLSTRMPGVQLDPVIRETVAAFGSRIGDTRRFGQGAQQITTALELFYTMKTTAVDKARVWSALSDRTGIGQGQLVHQFETGVLDGLATSGDPAAATLVAQYRERGYTLTPGQAVPVGPYPHDPPDPAAASVSSVPPVSPALPAASGVVPLSDTDVTVAHIGVLKHVQARYSAQGPAQGSRGRRPSGPSFG